MNWAVKLSITERVVTVAERAARPGMGPGTGAGIGAGIGPGATARSEQRRRCAVVIDRDPEVVSGLTALLMPQLDVQSAVSPLSAAMLLDQLQHVDLAFVELELPDFAGEQLLQQLGRWPDAIRVLLTRKSLADPAVANTGANTGAPKTAGRRPSALTASALTASGLTASALTASALTASQLPRNAYLAHLVLNKPVSAQVVRALQRATLGLLRI